MSTVAEAPPTTTTPRPGWLRIAVAAARPQTLPASLAPVVAGTALAWRDGGLRWGPAAAALLGALCIQLGTNLHNDAADAGRGADGPDRLGPPRVVAQGWASRRAVLVWATLLFALACVPGAYLVALGGWPILALGLASLLCGWLYTGGPWPLAYLGLGELFVVAFFGVGAGLGHLLRADRRDPARAGAVRGGDRRLRGRDPGREQPPRPGGRPRRRTKNTLAVRLGEGFARAEHALCLLGPFALALALFAATRWSGWLVTLAALPLALREVVLARPEGRPRPRPAPRRRGAGRAALRAAAPRRRGRGARHEARAPPLRPAPRPPGPRPRHAPRLAARLERGGAQGWGEAACWPGFGAGVRATRDALHELLRDRRPLERALDAATARDLEGVAAALAALGAPAARHAAELAALDLAGRLRGAPLAATLAAGRRPGRASSSTRSSPTPTRPARRGRWASGP